jgi:hypothetical protein
MPCDGLIPRPRSFTYSVQDWDTKRAAKVKEKGIIIIIIIIIIIL